MRTIKGPGIFVAQYLSDSPPFNNLPNIAKWAASLGYQGIQIPIDTRLIDIDFAASSQYYCDEILNVLADVGIELTELSSHLQGQLIAVHPAYDIPFDGFAPPELRKDRDKRDEWARDVLFKAAKASKSLGLKAHATFSGALAWPYMYPWPQRPAALVEAAFSELGKRWKPILDAFDQEGVDVCFELHPGEDLHDGVSFERFLKVVDNHLRACILYDPSHMVLQQMDYLEFIDIYHERIKAFHVKDAEFRPNGRQAVYGGYSEWTDRAGRFRALGDGQVDFKQIFTRLAKYGYEGCATLEVECAFKDKMVCAKEGASRMSEFIIPVGEGAFDDFAGLGMEEEDMRKMLAI